MNRFRVVDTFNESEVTVYHPSGRTSRVTPEQAKAHADYRRKQRQGTSEDELPGHSSRPSNDPGSHAPSVKGAERGRRKVRGSRRETVNPDGTTQTHNTKKAQKHLKDRLKAKHGERLMNQKKLKEAYIRSNAQLAFVISERTRVSILPGGESGTGKPATQITRFDSRGNARLKRTITDPKRAERIRRATERRGGREFGRKPSGEEFGVVFAPKRNQPTEGK